MNRRRVPLIVYVAGARTQIGEATIEQPSDDPKCDVAVVIELDKDTPLRDQLIGILRRHNP